MKTLLRSILLAVMALSALSSCEDRERIEINEIPGPYKTVVMEMTVNMNDQTDLETGVQWLFSELVKNTIYWGDGVVEDAKGELKHWYRKTGKYYVTIKGLDDTPTCQINNIGIIEEIFWPIP